MNSKGMPLGLTLGGGLILGLILFLAPVALKLGGAQTTMMMGAGLVLMAGSIVSLIVAKLIRHVPADLAYVRTGQGGAKVIMDGFGMYIPMLHELTPVSLQTFKIPVKRTGPSALITKDFLRADVEAVFYVKVPKEADRIKQAAATLGEFTGAQDLAKVTELVEEKFVAALRTVAATMELNDLNSKRDEFQQAVEGIVAKDLEENGLKLETVSIASLDQADPSTMQPDKNTFDAQGLKRITDVIQSMRKERNRIERETEQEVKTQDVTTAKYVAEQEVQESEAIAKANAEKANAAAKADADAKSFAAERAREAGIAEVESQRAIELKDIERQKALEVANRGREEANEVAERNKMKAIEVADQQRQIAVAEAEKARAEAEAEQLAAEALREAKEQEVETVKITATANRDKERQVIEEQAAAQKQQIKEQMQADVEAYKVTKQAEAKKKAAEDEAAAILRKAEADKDAEVLHAEGQKAVQIVPVEVDREQVAVERERVAVKRADLEAQAQFQDIAKDLQITIAAIEAERDARIAASKAVGEALGRADMQIFGDPDTLRSLTDRFYQGQSVGTFLDGLKGSMPESVSKGVSSILGKVAEKAGVDLSDVTPAGVTDEADETTDETTQS